MLQTTQTAMTGSPGNNTSAALERARQIYAGRTAEVAGVKFTFAVDDSARTCQSLRQVYSDINVSDDFKRKLTLAVLAVELSNILKGSFDCSRNLDTVYVDNTRVIHSDFVSCSGAVCDQEGYKQLTKVLIDSLGSARGSGADLGQVKPLIEAELKRLRASGQKISPLVIELHRAFENLEGVVSQLDSEKDGPGLLISAVSAGVCPQAQAAILAETPFLLKSPIRHWLQSGNIPGALRAFLPPAVKDCELIKLS